MGSYKLHDYKAGGQSDGAYRLLHTDRQGLGELLGSRMGGWLGKWGAAGSNCNGETDLSLHHRQVLSTLTRGV